MTEVNRRVTQLSRKDKALLFERLRQRERDKEPAAGMARRIERRTGSEPPPLSFSQQRLWFLDRLHPGDPAYNIPTVVRITGPLDPEALRRALEGVVERHEGLRTTFGVAAGQPVQLITPHLAIPLPVVDLAGLPRPETGDPEEVSRVYRAEIRRSFDLQRGPLLRAVLLRLGRQHHILILVVHHIVSDGWSASVLVRDVGAFYRAYAAAGPGGAIGPPDLPALPIQYADYAVWQRTWLQGEMLEKQLAFWRRRLDGAPAALDLPLDRPRPPLRTSAGAAFLGPVIEGAAADRLRRLAREAGTTPFAVLLAGQMAAFQRHSGQDDVSVGTAVANRNRVEIAELIGFFINSLVLRGDLAGDPTFRELLGRLRTVALEAFAHQDLPFEKLVEELRPERDPSRTPFFQVMFVLQNTPPSQPPTGELVFEGVQFETGAAKFDFTLSIREFEGFGFSGKFDYSTDIFDHATIARLSGHIERLLNAATADPDRRLSELPMLAEGELAQVVTGWNDTATVYPALPPQGAGLERCLHALFEARADRTPEAVAVEWEGGTLSYAELDARANRLARVLRRLGVAPEEAVAVCAERSPELIAGMLGILKAGAAWVPLDPAYPEARLAAMADDAGARVLLIQEALRERLPAVAAHRRAVPLPPGGDFDRESGERLSPGSPGTAGPGPDNLAYVLFTSGSTGRPKGVMVPHRAVVNRLLWAQDEYRFDAADAVLQKASIGFDFSVWETFAPLIAGARLVLARPDGQRDPGYLAEVIAARRVTVTHFAPSMLAVFLDQLDEAGAAACAATLRLVFSGGEALSPELRDRFLARLPGVPFHNEYGPTEAAIDATRQVCDSAPSLGQNRHRVPIGRPIANLRAAVVDRALRPVPIGAGGELLLAGLGLARGYAGRADLTAEKFVPNPFAEEPGERVYRTGDLVRWLPDGTIEFLGRVDRQVKVRGIRMELGEIEAALLALPGVRDAAVLVREDRPGDRRLVAYVSDVAGIAGVHREDAAEWAGELRRGLQQRLPEPMVPAAFVRLAALPLTPAGKVDRRALAALPPEAGVETRARGVHAPPRTPAEEVLASLYAEVLGIDATRNPVGRHDSFFDLGGHSLLATQLASRIRDAFGLELPLRALFEHPTVEDVARELEEVRARGGLAAPPIRRVARTGRTVPLPLSFAQQRLWFLDQLEPGTAFYNMIQQPRLLGPLRPAALSAALTEVVRRHESLRTTFGDRAGEPFQVVAPPSDRVIPLIDLAGLPEGLRERERARLRAEEARRPFDLARGPLLRAALVRAGETDHTALFTVHHIVSDGWSTRVLIFEMAALYAAFSAGRPPALPELPIQYPDYAVWQREWLQGDALESQLDYWRRRLGGVPGLQLPTDRPRPAVETFRGANRPVALPGELAAGLQALSRREGATLFMTLLAGFAALLSRWTGQSDIPVGSPIANRHRAETEGLIGFFANTLVLRADTGGDPTFRSLLGRVRALALEGYAHQEIPFEKLVEELQPERDMSRNPLFQVMLVLQNQPQREIEAGDLVMAGEGSDPGIAKFDLTQFWWEGAGDGLFGVLEHNTDLFDRSTMQRFFAHQEALLCAAVANPDRPVSELRLLCEGERHQLLSEWNETADPADLAAAVPIHRRVERQAAVTPDALAVSFGGLALTYRELNERANRLAHTLIRLGVRPESLVGICVERSVAMVTATLAVLKAGGALVALDPAYPIDRLAFIASDAKLPVLLTQTSMLDRFPDFPGAVLLFDGDTDPSPHERSNDPAVAVDLDHPIYAIYTSGSTGQPKGILVTHRAFTNLIDWQLRRSGLAPDARTAQLSTFGFCVSFQEIFSSWTAGASLVLASEMTRRDIDGLAAFLEAEQVERLYLPFAALKHLAEAASSRPLPGRLREVVTAGEQLQVTPAVRSMFERLPGCALHNQYGASETHVVSALALTGTPGDWPGIPAVGRPISNVSIHLLDSRFEPAPIGVAAELYAGGACLARCYLNDPVLTAQKLTPDPFSAEPGARLYRTGDQARRLADGTIEYHGRLDGQVKIRGFRVELGEVETTLARQPGVRDAAVLARRARPTDRDPRLVAWIVPQQPGTPESTEALFEELRSVLRQTLPEHMVPSAFVEVAALPVNANGKLDQAALPEPAAALFGRRGEYAPPRNPAEEGVAAILGEVLGIPRVGIHDSFFDLGGHSLLATQVVSRIRDRFAVELPLRTLFEEPTVAGLAGRLARAEGVALAPPILPFPRESGADLPLSFAQERMWFLHQLDPASPVYNMPVSLLLEGRLRPDLLEATLRTVVARHEALRTAFPSREGKPYQAVGPVPDRVLEEIDLRGLPEAERRAELARRARAEAAAPFDLAAGPLLRAALVRLAEDSAALLLTQHHIVSDGWSLGVLVREVVEVYRALAEGAAPALPPLPVQYADFAAWQRAWLSGERLESELEHWRRRLDGVPPLRLPADRRTPVRTLRGGTRFVSLPAGVQAALADLARREGATPFMALLAAFAAVLSRHAGQDDFAVGTPVANRNRSETEGLIGFFVNTLVLRADLAGAPGYAELVRRAKAVTLDAYAHQDLPFEKLVAEVQPDRDLSSTPLFQAMLVLQNTPSSALEVPGLRFSPLGGDGEAPAQFDLTLTFWELADGLAGTLRYAADRFEAATAERLAGHLGRLLAAALEEPERPVRELPMLSAAEAHQLLVEERVELRDEELPPVHALFEAWAARTPEAPALTFGAETVSYGELERRSRELAGRLRDLGVGPEVKVAILLDRTPELIVAILGVLRAGGAYVPLDPAHPAERREWILADSGAAVLIGVDGGHDSSTRLGPPASRRQLIFECRQDAGGPSRGLSGRNVTAAESAPMGAGSFQENLAYVIYTSGSTGRPKGVGVTHANAVRLLRETERWFAFGPQDAWTLFHSIAFDFSVWEVWGALAYGGRLVIVPEEVRRSAPDFAALLAREEVTVLNQTASAFRQLAQAPPSLRWILFGGEAVDPRGLRSWLAAEGPRRPRLVNLYGITETTVHVTYRPLTAADATSDRAVSPIGRPIPDLAVYLLDAAGQAVPLGAAGEIHVGGAGLARGYLGQPDRTAERFVPDPFSGRPGERLYRSGDLARRLPDGDLDFLGRADHQVKIRGHRIELGEVEAALLALPGVGAAAVLVEGAGEELRLVACVEGKDARDRQDGRDGGEELSAGELRAALQARLPEPMVPAAFLLLDALPLTANGKVDRRALEARLPEADRARARFVPPSGPAEEALAAIWAGLLGVERVSAHDDFFALGGHSLLATQLISRLRDRLGVEVALRTVFEEPTLAGLAARLASLPSARRLAAPVERPDTLPLSFAQERMWFLHRFDPESAAYNMPLALRLAGAVRPALLEATLRAVVERHEALRTAFPAEGGRPYQVVGPVPERVLAEVDLRGLPADRREPELARVASGVALAPFDLAAGPLLRAALVRLDGDEAEPATRESQEAALLLTQHHIVSDGWSMGVLVREVVEIYRALIERRAPELPPLPLQYADYAARQRAELQGERLEEALAFWHGELDGVPPLHLTLDRPRRPGRRPQGGTLGHVLPGSLQAEVGDLARAEGATPFMVLLAAFSGLLARDAGQDDFAVGTPVANRDRSEIEGLIGFFVNTLVLRADLAGTPGLRELVRRARARTLAAYAHQDVPFEKLVAELQPDRDLATTPLFQAMLVLQNAPAPFLDIPGLDLRLFGEDEGPAQLDLTLTVREGDGWMTALLRYDGGLFEAATVERLAGRFRRLLEAGLAAPERSFRELPVLSDAERHQLLVEERGAARVADGEPLLPLHARFEAWAARTPDAPALTFEGETVSYGELERRSAALAGRLRELGVGPEVRVAICLDRTPELIVAMLGVLRAGGAYVPLDPTHPAERREWILEDSGSAVLIEGGGALSREAGEGRGGGGPLHPANLAYVIYTSGSTGRPKGVGVTHATAARLLRETEGPLGLGPDDAWTLFHSFAFDFSVWEIWGALACGGRLVIVPEETRRSPADFAGLLRRERVTVLNQTASAFNALATSGALAASGDALRWILFGGEALDPQTLRPWLAARGDSRPRLANLYGITETTVHVTFRLLSEEDARADRSWSPIGRALPHLSVTVLDATGEPVPLGVTGEIHVGGAGLARGYLGQGDRTAECFVPDPWSGEPGARLYRSGDLARRLPDGGLDFLGRVDHQVKVRGHRIELGEVEAALRAHPDVRDAAVLFDTAGGDPRLVACVAGPALAPESLPALRAFLRDRLPEPMLPAAFLVLAELPLTANGKVDRRALAARLPAADRAQAEYQAPRGPVEEGLAALWTELLGVERPGARDGFFALGGHSLLAVQLASRIRDRFGVEVPLRTLFEEPDLAGLAARVEALRQEAPGSAPVLRPVSRTGPLPLSFAQERMWFLHQLDPGSAVHHIPLFLRLHGEVRPALLDATLRAVIERHEVLRTTFRAEGGLPVQVIGPVPERGLAEVDLRALPAAAREAELLRLALEEAQRPFDLAGGLPMRATLARLGEDDAALLVVQHHIASDGWSLGVMVKEVAEIYRAGLDGAAGIAPLLPALPIQYADYAAWQREHLSGERLAAAIEPWRERLANVPVLELPADRPRAAVHTTRGALVAAHWPASLAAGLHAVARAHGATLFMAGLAGYLALLARVTGQEDLAVGTVSANRDRSEIEGLIGFFVNTLVLRTGVDGDPAFGEIVDRARRATLDAFANQDLPFEKLVAELRPERSLSHTPLFQTLFVLQNAPVGALEAPRVLLAPLDLPSYGERATEFDLSVHLRETEAGLGVTLEHNRDLFDRATVQRLGERFQRLLAAAVANPGLRLSELPVMAQGEREQVLAAGRGPERPAASRTLHELIAERARLAPGAPAVEHRGLRLTYAELLDRAGRLAAHLRRLGVGPESRVGLAAARTPDAIAGMLAVLEAGGAYVPLDPAYPADRLAWMVADAGIEILLTDGTLAGRLSGVQEVPLAAAAEEAPSSPSLPSFASSFPETAAYVLYTSGSTGLPKGVVVPHRAIASYALEAAEAYGITPADRVLQFASLSFDISAEEIYATLVAGACLVLRSDEMAGSAETFFREAGWLGLTVLDLPTAYWHELVGGLEAAAAAGQALELPASLRLVILGGEEARADRWAVWREQAGEGVRLVNSYGPTEATVVATRQEMAAGWAGDPARVPIGRPIAGAWGAVADRRLRPVPSGVAGELLLGGTGVARGYLGRPGLTAERFVPDAWSGAPGARLYRTGDRARFRAEQDGIGALEYLGRLDAQVKIRGFRVEPGEIEAALTRLPEVAAAAVVVHSAPGKPAGLAAYVVPAAGAPEDLDLEAVRRALAAGLPGPLVPAAFVALPALPLTPNGKLDRKRLPAPERPSGGGGAFEPPSSEGERELASIWAEVLGVERVGVRDSFFDLGGHSLLLPRVQAAVKQRLGKELPLLKLFEHPTVGGLASYLAQSGTDEVSGAPDPGSRDRAQRQRAGLEAQRQRLAVRNRSRP